jgi:hypothetical protein
MQHGDLGLGKLASQPTIRGPCDTRERSPRPPTTSSPSRVSAETPPYPSPLPVYGSPASVISSSLRSKELRPEGQTSSFSHASDFRRRSGPVMSDPSPGAPATSPPRRQLRGTEPKLLEFSRPGGYPFAEGEPGSAPGPARLLAPRRRHVDVRAKSIQNTT